MQDEDKTRSQLIQELEELRRQVSELEAQISTRENEGVPLQNLLFNSIDAIHQPLAVKNTNGVYVVANQAFAEYLGKKPAEIIGKTDYDFFATAEASKNNEDDQQVISGKSQGVYPLNHAVYLIKIPFRQPGASELAGLLYLITNLSKINKFEQALQDCENRFTSLLEKMTHGVAVLIAENSGEDFYFKFANPLAVRLYGTTKEKIIGKSVFSFFPDREKNELFVALQKVWNTGESEYLPAVCEKISNQHGWRDYNIYKLPSGEVVTIFEDITERMQVLFELFDQEKLLRNIAENYPNSYVAIIGNDYKIRFISGQEFQKKYLEPGQFFGKTLEQMLGTDVATVHPNYDKTFQGERTAFELLNGNQYLFYRTVPLAAEDGNIYSILVVVENITRRKQTEDALRESEERYRLLLESIQDSVYVLDREWRHTLVNDAAETFTKLPKVKLLGGRLPDLFPGVEATPFFQTFKRVMETRIPDSTTAEFIFEDGRRGCYEVRVYPVPEGILCISRDITAHWQAEEKLRQTTLLLQAFFKNSPAPVSIFDCEGRYLQLNQAIVDIIGLSESEILGKTFNEMLPPDVAMNFMKRVRQLTESRLPMVVEDRIIVNGSERVFQTFLFPIPENSGIPHAIGSIANDISEQKQAESQLKRHKAILEVLINSPQETVALLDPDGTLMNINLSGAKRFGKLPEEMIGKNIQQFLPKSLWARRKARLNEVIRTGIPAHFEDQRQGMILKNSVFPVNDPDSGEILGISIFSEEITSQKLAENKLRQSEQILNNTQKLTKIGGWEWDVKKHTMYWTDETYRIHGFDPQKIEPGATEHVDRSVECYEPEHRPVILAAFNACAEKGIPYDLEFPFTTALGKKIWIRTTAKAEHEQGKVVRVIGNIMDISERKQAQEEKARLETQIRRSQRMESIGTLAGGIAHDFNNLLTPIIGYADLALMELPEESALHDDLKTIINAANRAKDLVKQMLAFSRQAEQERRPLELQLVVKEAIKLLRPSIPSTIEIQQRMDTLCEKVLADPSRMHQVIVNLCTNSFHAMEETGGVLTIELKQVQVDEITAKIYPHLEAKEYVRLTISDTGIGMDEATQERVFDPFFTTKPVNKGTGLGLSVVHGIVLSHEGEVMVNSEPGKGTTVHVYLPIVTEQLSKPGPQTANAISRGQEKILLVDDEIAVGEMLKKMLERIGYEVRLCHNSVAALYEFRKHPNAFDLVITDLTMPRITGLDLAKNLHKIRPEIPVILTTGYGENVTSDLLVKSGINKIIGKPFDLQQLSLEIRKLMKKSE